MIKQANHAYAEDQRVYDEVTKRSSSPQAAPYPSLAAHLAGMKAQVDIEQPGHGAARHPGAGNEQASPRATAMSFIRTCRNGPRS